MGNRKQIEMDSLVKFIKENGIIFHIYIYKETNKIIDGNHRLLVANELNFDKVPVKYISSSNEIDKNSQTWNNILKGEILNGRKREETKNIIKQNKFNSEYKTGSNEISSGISRRISTNGQNNKLVGKNVGFSNGYRNENSNVGNDSRTEVNKNTTENLNDPPKMVHRSTEVKEEYHIAQAKGGMHSLYYKRENERVFRKTFGTPMLWGFLIGLALLLLALYHL